MNISVYLYTGHISYEDVIIKMVVLKMKKLRIVWSKNIS